MVHESIHIKINTLSNDIRGTGNSCQIKISPIRLIVIHCGIYGITKNEIM